MVIISCSIFYYEIGQKHIPRRGAGRGGGVVLEYPNPVCDSPFDNLTHWGRDKMAVISQTQIANAISGMKMYEFRLIFH